jgi:AcrR family transcriptional regulator
VARDHALDDLVASEARFSDRTDERSRPDVRRELLAAAVDLFSARGYQATSVNDIVARAGFTKGAFYHYFRSKEALLLEIHDQFIEYGLCKGREILKRHDPPDESLALLMRELLRQVELYRPEMTIFLQESRYVSYDEFPEAKRKRDEYEQIVLTIVERGIESGMFRADLKSTRILAFGITGMCVWAYQWLSPGGALSADEIGGMYADVILQGLMRPQLPA